MSSASASSGSTWMVYAFLTVLCWGLYGVLLHTGQMGMGDPASGRYKAFLWVGIAYVLIAVLAPALMIAFGGGGWSMTGKGVFWSLIAGAAGAVGAFGVLLAFGAKGPPAVVMSIVFAGAPIVNALVSLTLHPPHGGIKTLAWQFYAGIVLAALGGTLVTLYKPAPPSANPATRAEQP